MYIYIYIYIYIHIHKNFKSINNVLHAKMVLKTRLFIKNLSLSLQTFRQSLSAYIYIVVTRYGNLM